MKKMLAVLFVAVLVLGLGASTAQAISLTVGDMYYLGSVADGTPSGDANEVGYVNYLRLMAAGTTANDVDLGFDPQDFVRSANVWAGMPLPVFAAPKIDNTNTFNSTGFLYLLAKYGAGQDFQVSHVWYNPAGFFGSTTLPAGTASTASNLSHISKFNAVTTVPDGGMTLMLLGGALVGIGALRRKFRA